METLSSDVLMQIVLEFSLKDIIPLCQTSKRFNKVICNNETFWINKTMKDYPKQYQIIIDRKIPINWKKLYFRISAVEAGKAKFVKISTSKSLAAEIMKQYTPKWSNPSGLLPNDISGWFLKLDKNTNNIVYLYPGSYFGNQIPTPGENHPKIMLKISFPENKVEEIPWDESVLGEILHYRRGDGKVSWFTDTYDFKIEYDGGSRDQVFNVYSIE